MAGTICGYGAKTSLFYKKSKDLDIYSEKRRGEGSLHPRPKGRGIRDPLRSLSNKKQKFSIKITDKIRIKI